MLKYTLWAKNLKNPFKKDCTFYSEKPVVRKRYQEVVLE